MRVEAGGASVEVQGRVAAIIRRLITAETVLNTHDRITVRIECSGERVEVFAEAAVRLPRAPEEARL